MKLFYHFTNIHGGVSKAPYKSLNLALHVGDNALDVDQNRNIIKKKFDLPQMAFMEQVHGCDIEILNDAKMPPTCDGIITDKPNLALCVLVADCIPLLLYDGKNKVIGAIHAGRAGVFGKIATKALNELSNNYGTKSFQVRAILGPSIKQCCYELGGDILKFAKENYPLHLKNNHLDIRGILINELEKLGVEILDLNTCTCCDKNLFSYRRDKITGRNAGIIMLRD